MTAKRTPAKLPAQRPTLTVHLNSGSTYDGWEATFWTDFPARLFDQLASDDLQVVLTAVESIVADHNMPDSQGALAESIRDVPIAGLLAVLTEFGQQFGKLPNR